MSTAQWIVSALALIAVSALALTPLFLPMAILLGTLITILLYRIGNSLQKGFNEHTKAMQAIYDEISGQDRGDRFAAGARATPPEPN